jgi:hypothetical protein
MSILVVAASGRNPRCHTRSLLQQSRRQQQSLHLRQKVRLPLSPLQEQNLHLPPSL